MSIKIGNGPYLDGASPWKWAKDCSFDRQNPETLWTIKPLFLMVRKRTLPPPLNRETSAPNMDYLRGAKFGEN